MLHTMLHFIYLEERGTLVIISRGLLLESLKELKVTRSHRSHGGQPIALQRNLLEQNLQLLCLWTQFLIQYGEPNLK
ncbi:rCG42071 [Rattus norvegicus]|uniref:RCG42071 n=1 Tax=Rattus norvegicus TaxID=10116 RepID=A6JUZ8_RAT|nr:rCG42071 [Rattus norvegicus]